jgi:hypothetical protein
VAGLAIHTLRIIQNACKVWEEAVLSIKPACYFRTNAI